VHGENNTVKRQVRVCRCGTVALCWTDAREVDKEQVDHHVHSKQDMHLIARRIMSVKGGTVSIKCRYNVEYFVKDGG
jgi:chaperonin GroEL (HSP60 family)